MEIIAYILLVPFIMVTYYALERMAHWRSQANHWRALANACIDAYNRRYLGSKEE